MAHPLENITHLFNQCSAFVVEWNEEGVTMPEERLRKHIADLQDALWSIAMPEVKAMYERLRKTDAP